ncbi:DUF4286 family protein [Pontimicrobium sp. IMCC45349]|jgi:hypothetical protein|uniref:DUF4286 family protein n=1 Tax=Pontimicrobium sp. IMCC45349 TaxID=3391574 RepID=UPI00399F8D77
MSKIIYNVTVNVDESIHEEWLDWIKKHIPEVLATGKFEGATFSKILVDEEMEGHTYSIQYKSYSRAALEAYYKDDAERLRTEGLKKFADKMLAFRTELEVIDQYAVNFT